MAVPRGHPNYRPPRGAKNPTLRQIQRGKRSGTPTGGKTREELERDLSNDEGLGTQQNDTLADAVKQEQRRLGEKYPGYKPTGASTKNIARNIVEYGSPISPSSRSPAQARVYPGYSGPTARETLLELKGGGVEAQKRLAAGDSKGVARTGLGAVIAGRQSAYTLASARIDPKTKKRVPFGGGMEGANVPDENLTKAGLEKLFYRRGVRAAEQKVGRSLNREFSGFKDAAQKVGIEKVLGYQEGSTLSVIEKPPEPLTKEEQANIWRDLGVYDRQDFFRDQQKDYGLVEGGGAIYPDKEFMKFGMVGAIAPKGYDLESAKVIPMSLSGFGKISGSVKYSYVEKEPDMSDINKAAESQLGRFKSKIPIWKNVVNPVYDYGVSAFKNVEYTRRKALLKATSKAEKKEINIKYNAMLAAQKNPLNIEITSEKFAEVRYARGERNPVLRAGKELVGRVLNLDVPSIDIKPSPAAHAAITGTAIGVSFGLPAGAALRGGANLLGVGYAGGSGLAQLGAYSTASDVAVGATGMPAAGLVVGLGAAKVTGIASGRLKARIAPYNRAQVVSSALKRTDSFRVGQKIQSSTLAKDAQIGAGKRLYALHSKGPGTSVGGELPVWVRSSNVLGESKLIPTFSGKTFFKTTDVGLGRGLKGSNLGERVELDGGDLLIESKYKGSFRQLGTPLGTRQPVAQQSFIGTVYAGAGKNQRAYISTYKGLIGTKKTGVGMGVSDVSPNFYKAGSKPPIIVGGMESSHGGAYYPDKNIIRLGGKLKGVSTDKVLAHEIQHWKDTKSGIDYLYPYDKGGKPIQETRAMQAEGYTNKVLSDRVHVPGSKSGFFKKVHMVSGELKSFKENLPQYNKDIHISYSAGKAGKSIGDQVSSLKFLGEGTTKEFFKPASQADLKSIRMDVGKTSKVSGNVVSGFERAKVRVGGLVVDKFSKYVETFTKPDIKGGGGGGGGVKVFDLGGGSGQAQKAVLDLSGVGGNLQSLSRGYAASLKATSQFSQGSVIMPTFQVKSTGARSAAAQVQIIESKAIVKPSQQVLVSESLNDYSKVGGVGDFARSSILVGQSKIGLRSKSRQVSETRSALLLKQGGDQVSKLGGATLKGLGNQKTQSKVLENLLVEKQKQTQVVQHKQVQMVQPKLDARLIAHVGGGGVVAGGYGFFKAGGVPGFGGGGRGRSKPFQATKYTLKNPWPDAEKFADKILGTGKKKRRRRKK